MNIADAALWLVTLFYVLITVRFEMKIRHIPDRRQRPDKLSLVQGQFKEGLLSAAVMSAIFPSKNAAKLKDALELGGAILVLWLIGRMLHRMRVV